MINYDAERLACTIKDNLFQDNPNANISKSERIISLGAGAFIAFRGLSNIISNPLLAVTELAIGSGLIYRGSTGFCAVKNFVEKDALPEGTVVRESYLVETI